MMAPIYSKRVSRPQHGVGTQGELGVIPDLIREMRFWWNPVCSKYWRTESCTERTLGIWKQSPLTYLVNTDYFMQVRKLTWGQGKDHLKVLQVTVSIPERSGNNGCSYMTDQKNIIHRALGRVPTKILPQWWGIN